MNEQESSNRVTFAILLCGLFIVAFIDHLISPPDRLDPSDLYNLPNTFISEKECARLAKIYDGTRMAPKECGENVPLRIDYRNIFSSAIAYNDKEASQK